MARVVAHLREFGPSSSCSSVRADGLEGDPLALGTRRSFTRTAPQPVPSGERVRRRPVMAFGGGGYNRDNLARAWCGVLRELISA